MSRRVNTYPSNISSSSFQWVLEEEKAENTQCYCKLFDVEVLSLGALSEVILSSHQSHCATPSTCLHGLHKGPLETCGESTLQTTSPRSSMNCPRNIVRSHYTSFRVRGTSVLAALFYSQLLHSSAPLRMALHMGHGENEQGALECTLLLCLHTLAITHSDNMS